MRKVIHVKCHTVKTVKPKPDPQRVEIPPTNLLDVWEFLSEHDKQEETLSHLDMCWNGWHLDDQGLLVTPGGEKISNDSETSERFLNRQWHKKWDKILKGSKYDGWERVSNESIRDPNGKLYTQSDDEYYDFVTFLGLEELLGNHNDDNKED